jgi:predicted transcriptional regulator YdeE
MNYKIEKVEKKRVVGISVRTSNERFGEDVPPLWERFHYERLADKMEGRVNHNLMAIYTDYEGDYNKPYTYLAACEVESTAPVPKGMNFVDIPATSYAVFPASGLFPSALILAWHTIWNSDLRRAYKTDFELYPEGFNPQGTSEIKIYISI